MWGKSKMDMGRMGMHMEHIDPFLLALWHNADDATKKMWATRMLDEKIAMKEGYIKHLQYKIETMKMLKSAVEKM
jgi:hypothetical protein